MSFHAHRLVGLDHLDKAMKTASAVQKKPASAVNKKPACVMLKKQTFVVRQKRTNVAPTSCRIRRYNENTEAIKDAYGLVNFERVLEQFLLTLTHT